MRRSVKLALRQSEIREKLNALLGVESRSAEQQAEMEELTKKGQEIEPELRAALVAEAESDQRAAENFRNQRPEDVELRQLIAGATISEIVNCAREHRSATGRTAELQQHFGIGSNQVPLELLRQRPEHRAVTPGISSTAATEAETVIPIFADGDLAFLNIPMEIVPAGESVHPVLTTRATVKTHSDSTDVPETDGSFAVKALAPIRSQASFVFRRQDATRFGGMEMALRESLTRSLSENEDALFAGELRKATASGGLGNATPINSTNTATFQKYKEAAAGAVDGRYARMKSDIRLLVGSPVYAHMDSVYTTNGDDSALEQLQRQTGGISVGIHTPAAASGVQDFIVRKGMARDAVQVSWDGLTVIFDELTRSGGGEIEITAVLMSARAVLRTDGFARLSAKTT